MYINNPTAFENIGATIGVPSSLKHTSDGRLCIAYPTGNNQRKYYYTYDTGNTWYQSRSLGAVTYNSYILAIEWDFTDSYWYAYMDCFVYRAIDGMTWVFYSNTNVISFIIATVPISDLDPLSPKRITEKILGNPNTPTIMTIRITIGLDGNGKRMIMSNYNDKLLYSSLFSILNLFILNLILFFVAFFLHCIINLHKIMHTPPIQDYI
jgi:hypothetical protein